MLAWERMELGLTTTNISCIFRPPDRTSLEQAFGMLVGGHRQAGPSRDKIGELLSSGADYAGMSFEPTGEQRKPLVTSRHR